MPASLLGNPLSFLSSLYGSRTDRRYRLLVEQLDEVVFLVSPKNGRVLDANHKAVEFTGYSREYLTQLSLSGLIADEYESSILLDVRTLVEGASREFYNVPFQTHSGGIASADIRIAQAGKQDDKAIVLIMARDMRLRVATEDAQEQRKQSLSALTHLTSLLLDPSERAFERAVHLCRDFLTADLLGTYLAPAEDQTEGAVSGPVLPEFELWHVDPQSSKLPSSLQQTDLHPEHDTMGWSAGQQPQSPLAHAARDSGCSELITCQIGPSNAPHGILAAGFRSGNETLELAPARTKIAAAYLTALTQLHKHQQRAKYTALRAHNAELNLDTVLTKMIDGAIGVDPEGRITRVNPASEQLLGFHEQEMVEEQLEDFIAPVPIASAIVESLARGEQYEINDVTIIKRDGDDIYVSLTAVPVDNSVGETAGGLILIRNRTERRALEKKAHHLERRAFVGEMTARFAHEVRNPLSAIKLSLDYLKMEIADQDPLQDKLDQMSHEADRIENLLANTLVIVKPVELRLEPTDMGEFIQKFASRWQIRKQREHIDYDISLAPDTPLALADSDKIGQVFENLFDNAMQAMGDLGGIISINVQPNPPSSTLQGTYVQVNIADKGPGIEPDVLERIFEPFFTTKRKEGTGLGLPIVQQIVQAHNGTLEVQSTPSVGTVFSVLLPQATNYPSLQSQENVK